MRGKWDGLEEYVHGEKVVVCREERAKRDACSYNYGGVYQMLTKLPAMVFQRTRCLSLYFTRRVISRVLIDA